VTTALTIEVRELIDTLAAPHVGGHTCTNGWVHHRETCPVRATLDQITAITEHLEQRVHAAAHNPDTIDTIVVAMLSGTPLTDVPAEAADGWRVVARLGVEALAHHLDTTTN
jgi:hypothetical protein